MNLHRGDLYKCCSCGAIAVMVNGCDCKECGCGAEFEKLNFHNENEEIGEKHVPVLEEKGDQVVIKVGSVLHPMIEDHYIILIQVWFGTKVLTQNYLYPGDKPVVRISKKDLPEIEDLKIVSYCNIHGAWKTE